ncbi:Fe-Mn family superoxide dismutase [Patescibacteria group bacterium]|nr:Fe-Mn family superoxide dismutase [Patescibacteria group bacterium]MBU1613295.1 Fe-Mn family superoxide dismutase [Patescibacteria group bacterium]
MYTAKNYEHLLGLTGLSDNLLKNHFTLYQGYVTNFNKLFDAIVKLDEEGKHANPEFAELKRRFGWEFNGMRLHELYFENLTVEHKEPDAESKLYKKIVEQYGSFESWEKYFKATGAMRGIGWAVVYYDKLGDKIFGVWVNEHDVGHLTGATPLLVLDVFEHAYLADYGLKRADYIEAFFKAIDWQVVEGRI